MMTLLVLLLATVAAAGSGVVTQLGNRYFQLELTTATMASSPTPAPGPPSGGGGDGPSLPTFCGGVSGPGMLLRGEHPEVHTLRLSSNDADATIDKIDFASYGTFGCLWEGRQQLQVRMHGVAASAVASVAARPVASGVSARAPRLT